MSKNNPTTEPTAQAAKAAPTEPVKSALLVGLESNALEAALPVLIRQLEEIRDAFVNKRHPRRKQIEAAAPWAARIVAQLRPKVAFLLHEMGLRKDMAG